MSTPSAEAKCELRVRYSQNGKQISDELFRMVPFFWTKQDEAEAKQVAQLIVDLNGCGTAEVYLLQNNCITHLSSHHARGGVR